MKRLGYLVFVLVLAASCTHAPPNLSPAATVAFNNTRVIKGLDLLRDTVVSANMQVPPLVSTETTRKIVQYHQSTLTVMQASATGWRASTVAGLDEVGKNLPPAERQLIVPYIALVKTILAEVAQ